MAKRLGLLAMASKLFSKLELFNGSTSFELVPSPDVAAAAARILDLLLLRLLSACFFLALAFGLDRFKLAI